MNNSNKSRTKKPRNLKVQPETAANVRGGWFLRIPPITSTTTTTTTTTPIKIDGIQGESHDGRFRDIIE